MVLIDSYDDVLREGARFGYYNEALDFITHFLSSGLKSNSENISFAVITGTLPALSNGTYGGANNISVYTVTDSKYSRYFGFTPDEVKALLKAAGHEEKYDEARRWYGGYTCSEDIGELFRPESVIRYIIDGCTPHNHGSPTYAIKDKAVLTDLHSGKSVSARIAQSGLYDPDSNDIWSRLAHEGYLVPSNGTIPGCVSLSVPNEEARLNLKAGI